MSESQLLQDPKLIRLQRVITRIHAQLPGVGAGEMVPRLFHVPTPEPVSLPPSPTERDAELLALVRSVLGVRRAMRAAHTAV